MFRVSMMSRHSALERTAKEFRRAAVPRLNVECAHIHPVENR